MLIDFLDKNLKELNENNVKLRVLGSSEGVPTRVMESIDESLKITRENNGLNLNIAFNYGSRLEIIKAVKKMVKDGFVI